MLLRRLWLIVLITVIAAGLSVTYALTATEWFRADVLLAPAEDQSVPDIGGAFGSIAGQLAGVDTQSGGTAEALAVLGSREFARDFINENNILPIFFDERWDSRNETWLVEAGEDPPDIRDGVKLFRKNILSVKEGDAGMVSVSIEWKDRDLATRWVMDLVARLNRRMRDQALEEASANLDYLQGELANTSLVTIQQSIGRLMESEFQKLMMARGRTEFSFRVIDPAVVPKERSRPRRALIAVLGTMLGGFLGFLVALILGLRSRR